MNFLDSNWAVHENFLAVLEHNEWLLYNLLDAGNSPNAINRQNQTVQLIAFFSHDDETAEMNYDK